MKLNMSNLLLAFGLSIAAVNGQAATFQADITINPSLYSSISPVAPFFLDFQLNSGGDASSLVSNTVSLSNFTFWGAGSPGATGSSNVSGNVSGDLSSTISLTDNASNPYNEFFQSFSNGVKHIRFTIETTTAVNAPAPDVFTTAILDSSSGNPQIATTDPLTLSFISITLSDTVQTAAYSSIDTPASINAAISAVPEPSAILMFGTACLSLLGVKFRNRRLTA